MASRMQKVYACAVFLHSRQSLLAENALFIDSASRVRLVDQCRAFSTHQHSDTASKRQTDKPLNQAFPNVSLTWSAPAEDSRAKPNQSLKPAVKGNTTRPYYLKLRAAAAVRIKERASTKVSKDKADLRVRLAALKSKQRSIDLAAKLKTALIAGIAAAKAKQKVINSTARHSAAAMTKRKTLARAAAHKKQVAAGIRERTLQAVKVRTQLREAADKRKQLAKLHHVKATAAKRQALIVKRAPSAYALFLKDRFLTLEHLTTIQRFQTIGKEFKELPLNKKQVYEDAAVKLKVEVYAKRAVIKGAQIRRAPSAYIMFYVSQHKAVKAANPTAKATDLAKLIGKQWNGLSEAEKQGFKSQAV